MIIENIEEKQRQKDALYSTINQLNIEDLKILTLIANRLDAIKELGILMRLLWEK